MQKNDTMHCTTRQRNSKGWFLYFKLILITGIFVPLLVAGFIWILDARHDFFKEWKITSRNEDLLEKLKAFPTDAQTDFNEYSMNVQLSNTVALDRGLPDTRNLECQDVQFSGKVKVSVIVPFYDESWSMLLRMLHSVVDRTPDDLLEEIILIDDKSSHDYLKAPLDEYCKLLSLKIKIIRNEHREGLMRGRMMGAKEAKAETLVFLDAHVECNEGWLDPLLQIVSDHPRAIAVPTIDNIDPNNIEYESWVNMAYGGFTWNMEYQWKVLPENLVNQLKGKTQPFPSPTTIGCAMAINREYFFELGGFDEGMFIWGGENLEISFKTWMCGDGLYISPCSRVGHLFRVILPYVFPTMYGGGMIRQKNYQRVAEVWMDDYKELFYASTGVRVNMTRSERSSLNDRIALRERLRCHSFAWFLTNVIPEMPMPQPTARYFGQMKNMGSFSCLTLHDSVLTSSFCGWQTNNQYFSLTSNRHITSYNGTQCLTATADSASVSFDECDPELHRQIWFFNTEYSKDNRQTESDPNSGVACVYPKASSVGATLCLAMSSEGALFLQEEMTYPGVALVWSFTNKFFKM